MTAYCDHEEKEYNPFSLTWLGNDQEAAVLEKLKSYNYFIGIGDNELRSMVYHRLSARLGRPSNAIHVSAVISPSAKMQDAVFIAARATINPLVILGTGVICNTSCSIDHECVIGDFAHIGPGAVLSGNVKVGKESFVGAGAIIKQGIKIGDRVMIGAGCVVVKDVPDNMVMVGNPQKELRKK